MNSQDHQYRLPPAKRGRAQDGSRDDLIIGAAIELLGANGYHALTMTDVAARAGVSKATLYRRWTAKADLVADAVATLSPMATPRYPGTSVRDDLLALIEQAGNCDDNSEIVTATYEMARSHPDLYRTVSARFGAFLRMELEVVSTRAVAAGHTPLSDLELDLLRDTTMALLGHYGGPSGEPVTRERLIDLVDHVLLVLLTGMRGYATGESRAAGKLAARNGKRPGDLVSAAGERPEIRP